ncbi:hypothetical protein AB7211_15520 [Providencia rettgeri]|nr:hypothetical protein [Providencia rettgeri]ELR5182744.1 hypothetical protein [Providencia rettgeri]
MSDKKDNNKGFTVIRIGNGAKVEKLQAMGNMVITDDLSAIDSIISIDDNGEVKDLEADSNEVHTSESYRQKLKHDRQGFFDGLHEIQADINSIQNDIIAFKIKKELVDAQNQPMTPKGEFTFKKILGDILSMSKDVGCGVLTAVITKYLLGGGS